MKRLVIISLFLITLCASIAVAQTASAYFDKSNIKNIIVSMGIIPNDPVLGSRDYYTVRVFLKSSVNQFIGFDINCESEIAAVELANLIRKGRIKGFGHYTLSSGKYVQLPTGNVGYVINFYLFR